MRIGITIPMRDNGGPPLDTDGIARRARMIEQAGFDGIWMGDASFRGLATWPDPLMWLLSAAIATERVEIGTAIFQVPLRPAVDLAQRFLTLEGLARRRFSIGVGAGSTAAGHEAVGLAFEDRFRVFYDHMDTIRALCRGEAVGAADLAPWPEIVGGPRFLLGAWHSDISLKRASDGYDGWLCSAGRTTFGTMLDALKRYREMGGRRAIVATCSIGLDGPETPLTEDEPFTLRCGPHEAAERLHRLAEVGFDDILLKLDDPAHQGVFDGDITLERLEQVRSLLPRDERSVCV